MSAGFALRRHEAIGQSEMRHSDAVSRRDGNHGKKWTRERIVVLRSRRILRRRRLDGIRALPLLDGVSRISRPRRTFRARAVRVPVRLDDGSSRIGKVPQVPVRPSGHVPRVVRMPEFRFGRRQLRRLRHLVQRDRPPLVRVRRVRVRSGIRRLFREVRRSVSRFEQLRIVRERVRDARERVRIE